MCDSFLSYNEEKIVLKSISKYDNPNNILIHMISFIKLIIRLIN